MSKNEVVIPKDRAVFWLDANGHWHNAAGKFQHPKIVSFFHASIRRDRDGYYLFQTRGEVTEKVYFHYEDTALFVFDAVHNGETILVLNTGERIALDPESLFVRNDQLYLSRGEERVKFTDRVLMKLSGMLDFKEGRYSIVAGNRVHEIPTMTD